MYAIHLEYEHDKMKINNWSELYMPNSLQTFQWIMYWWFYYVLLYFPLNFLHAAEHLFSLLFPCNISISYLFTGLSESSSLRMDLPSISGGISNPAISRIVGARSIFNTIWGFLKKNRTKQLKVYTIIPSNSNFHRIQGPEKAYFVTPANKRGHSLILFHEEN